MWNLKADIFSWKYDQQNLEKIILLGVVGDFMHYLLCHKKKKIVLCRCNWKRTVTARQWCIRQLLHYCMAPGVLRIGSGSDKYRKITFALWRISYCFLPLGPSMRMTDPLSFGKLEKVHLAHFASYVVKGVPPEGQNDCLLWARNFKWKYSTILECS